MQLVNIQTRNKVTKREFKQYHPNISLGNNPSLEMLNDRGYTLFEYTEPPVGDVVTEGESEQRDDGKLYQTWVVRDYTPEELEQQRLASIPASITPRQARLALLQEGLLSQVDPAINSLTSPAKESAQIEWEYATSIERDSAWINQLGGALNLDSEGIDNLFITASTL